MKKSKYTARLSNDRGQAAIEYVLLLIISVSLVLALVYQIFKPMQRYMDAYMGDYVACLLETGGLPSFGSDMMSAKDMGCTIAQFDKKDGSFGNSKGSNGQGGSGSESGDGSSGSSSNSSGGGGSDSSGGSSGRSGYAGSASRNGGRLARAPRKGAAGIEGGGQQGGRVVEIALDGNGSGSFFGGSRGSSYAIQTRRKVSSVNMSGWSESERKKLEKNSDAGRTKVIATDDMGPAPKKIMVKKPDVKTVLQEEKEELTVGNFIRYLFIAALIIALVIFIGGQALSMSKGDEN
ncbi:hypothetical protein [Bdellovibrio svalbardensis]|uniref:hypothetical protein n=1 Tax=Bdellovibrio svalbardensis TaxID=2972972 RepID=UPI002407DC50|nr:hypothetical protein [Bdellovibrio svalbardensis]